VGSFALLGSRIHHWAQSPGFWGELRQLDIVSLLSAHGVGAFVLHLVLDDSVALSAALVVSWLKPDGTIGQKALPTDSAEFHSAWPLEAISPCPGSPWPTLAGADVKLASFAEKIQ